MGEMSLHFLMGCNFVLFVVWMLLEFLPKH